MSGWIETPAEAAKRVKSLRLAWGDWFGSHEWSHWVTLTVGGQWSVERLKQRFEHEFVRFITKVGQGPVRYAFVIEGGALGEQPHIHALLYCTTKLDCTKLEAAWRYGRAQVTVYDPTKGAAYYLAKEIGGSVLDYGVSGRLPPLRKGGSDQEAA